MSRNLQHSAGEAKLYIIDSVHKKASFLLVEKWTWGWTLNCRLLKASLDRKWVLAPFFFVCPCDWPNPSEPATVSVSNVWVPTHTWRTCKQWFSYRGRVNMDWSTRGSIAKVTGFEPLVWATHILNFFAAVCGQPYSSWVALLGTLWLPVLAWKAWAWNNSVDPLRTSSYNHHTIDIVLRVSLVDILHEHEHWK